MGIVFWIMATTYLFCLWMNYTPRGIEFIYERQFLCASSRFRLVFYARCSTLQPCTCMPPTPKGIRSLPSQINNTRIITLEYLLKIS